MHQKYNITKDHVTYFRNWFIRYVNSFLASDAILRQKFMIRKEHTFDVSKEIVYIGSKINLDDKEILLAQVIALFHDIGRFEQYARYRTFVDIKSENHADLAIKILKENKVLDVLERTHQDIIIKAILYHNRLNIPEGEEAAVMLFSRLLRDADKIAILDFVTNYYDGRNFSRVSAFEPDLPDTLEISKDVMDCLMKGSIVNSKYIKTINDCKLAQMGWIYDINFTPTLQIVLDRDYLKLIRNALPLSRDIDDIYINIVKVLEVKLAN